MKKIIRFLIELIIFSIFMFAIFMVVGVIRNILERLPLIVIITGLFSLMIVFTILEFGDDV